MPDTATAPSPAATAADPAPRPGRRRGLGAVGWACLGWLVTVGLLALTADLLPLADPTQTRLGPPNTGPSLDHWFGTDPLGRDVLSRTIHGARVSLGIGIGATAIAFLTGGALGLVSGFRRRRLDNLLMAATDAALAFPMLVVVLAVVSFAGPSVRNILIVMGLGGAPAVIRLVRGATLSLAEREFVLASRALGARGRTTLWREIVPNVAPVAAVMGALGVGATIVAEGGLAFLGLSVQAPTPTWGGMINQARGALETDPTTALIPAAAMFLTVLSLSLLGDALRAAADVRQGALDRVPGRAARRQPRPAARPAVTAPAAPPPEGGALLEVRDLRTTFATAAGELVAVDGVSLTLRHGRTLGVVGESGSGKSVLIRSVLGLLPPATTRRTGEIRFDGADLSGRDADALRHVLGTRIGAVFQDPASSLNPVRSIGAQLTEPMRVHLGLSRRDARERAAALLRAVGIPEPGQRLGQYPHQLSGGMRQRVTIAMALTCDPVLLFADEPTTALDVSTQHQILELLDEQRRERDMALVLVSHDLAVISDWADQVAVMYAGQVVESGPVQEVLERPRMPYTRALLRAVPDLAGTAKELEPLAGQPPSLVDPPPGCRFQPRCPVARPDCAHGRPPLRAPDSAADHLVACWYPEGEHDGR